MTGIVTVTRTDMTWNSADTGDPEMFTLSMPDTTPFDTEEGQNKVYDLNIGSEPVGSTFSEEPFIHFMVAPGLPDLNITYIVPGYGDPGNCFLPVAGSGGKQCTPPNPGGSPFTFTNNGDATASSAVWEFRGVTSDHLSTWDGLFTSQFLGPGNGGTVDQPYQTVLAGFLTPGGNPSVSDSYSATLAVTVTPIPEPAPIYSLASGLVLVLAGLTLKRIRRSA